MGGIIINKYSQCNYFDQTTAAENYLDSITITKIPIDGFPVFDINTEEVGDVLQYKSGEFDLLISIDSGELSINGSSIYDFFIDDIRNYKYKADIVFGSNELIYSGIFDNSRIEYDNGSRILTIQCKTIEDELSSKLNNYLVGHLSSDMTFEEYLSILIPDAVELTGFSTSFVSYAALINAPTLKAVRNIQITGAWINSMTVWEQFQQLMQGLGLFYKVRLSGYPGGFVSVYIIQIYSLDNLTQGDELEVIDAKDTTLINKYDGLYISYRGHDTPSSYTIPGQRIELGAIRALNIDGDENIIIDDTFLFFETATAFVIDPEGIGGIYGKIIMHYPFIGAGSTKLFFKNRIKIIDLEKFAQTYYDWYYFYGVSVYDNIAYSRIFVEDGGYATQLYTYVLNIYYNKYINRSKKCKELKVIFDQNHKFDVFDKVTLTENNLNTDYYIIRIQDINLKDRTVQLSIVEI